jgi:hypothetical protein
MTNIISSVQEVARTKYSVTYSATVNGKVITMGGCSGWTAEQFVELIKVKLSLRQSWVNALAEDNFISRAFGRKV